ncbi:flagellar motor switch protein FliG [Profundibacterium mesophilum]|uniref:Flagellar motor switch protein FliG n=1 Tax=Profundibacterium mesophilum KAUST100406-0324 TaxID=1037889 RepID=A0A921NTU4_9RHOB|nr:flagellar motor switch protein FliG [Profundibacterium mesophilum]KAF0674634.1 Flagellar motor switch protein FliG [Profundibacterium mesophilum KAUST100406-0324]
MSSPSISMAATAARPTAPRRRFRGPEKAAILFLCLGEERGSSLMKKLSEDDIQKITRAMSGLGTISAEQVEEVMAEFSDHLTNGGGVVGSFAVAENLLRSFLPNDKVNNILKDIRGPMRERDLWSKFSNLHETVIANFLKGEHEQTAAVILTNVSAEIAAKVLPHLDREKARNIIERMIRIEAVPHHMMKEIEETLQSDVMAASSQPTSTEMQQRMADLFNRLDQTLFEELSPVLEERVPEQFLSIRQKMFTFDDLVRLDAQSLARVIRNLQGNTLPLALRGASKELRDHFLNALPGRSRDMLLDEMNLMGPVRGREARAAQTEIVDVAKDLAEEGIIVLPLADEDDEMLD